MLGPSGTVFLCTCYITNSGRRSGEPIGHIGVRIIIIIIYVTEVSTNFRRHLTRQQDIEVECENTAADDIVLAFERLYGQAAKIGREGELQEACLSHAIDQEAVNEALVSLIVIRNLSYRAVE